MPGLARLATPSPPWVEVLVLPGGRLPRDLQRELPDVAVRQLDGRRCGTKAALLAQAARAFQFPPHFGHNWDALEDCLADLDWLPATGHLLVVTSADRLLAAHPDDYATFVSILQSVGAEWGAGRGGIAARPPRPFHTLLAVAASRVARRDDWRAPLRRPPGAPGKP